MDDKRDAPVVLTGEELKHLPTGFLNIYRETGWKALRSGKPETALRSFHTAAAAYPEDLRTIVGRGITREQLKIINKGDEDANTALGWKDNDREAILLKAKCELAMGNYEDGLLMFNRGINKRGRREEFVVGKEATLGMLENCIGRYGGPALTNLQPAIQKMVKSKKKIKVVKTYRMQENCLEELSKKTTYSGSAEQWERNKEQQKLRNKEICSVYLGKLADDYQWCQSLSEDPADQKLQEIAGQALKEVDLQLSLLKARKPLYHLQNKPYYPTVKKENFYLRNIMCDVKIGEISRLFENLRKYLKTHETMKCIGEANKIKLILESFPKQFNSIKINHLEDLCNIMSLVYMDDMQLFGTVKENEERINIFLGFQSVNDDMWVDPIIQRSKFPFFDANKWQTMYKKYAKMAENDLERCWLHYEIARTYIMQKKWEFLIVEANKTITCARQCKHLHWKVCALFLVVIGLCYMKNREEALENLEDGIETALKLKNEDVLKFFNLIKEILGNKAEESFYESSDKVIKRREKSIIRIQTGMQSKEKASDLLSRMSYLPSDRRLVLVPGIKLKDDESKCGKSKSIIRGGDGGRLGLHPITKRTYHEFCNVSKNQQYS